MYDIYDSVSYNKSAVEIFLFDYSFRIRLYVIAHLKVSKIRDSSILFSRNKAFFTVNRFLNQKQIQFATDF